jgi:hypothetical protein
MQTPDGHIKATDIKFLGNTYLQRLDQLEVIIILRHKDVSIC